MTPRNKAPEPAEAAADWDVVDQASLDSFPASDPPAWGSSRAAPSASTVANPDTNVPADRSRWTVRLALGVVASGLALGGLALLGLKLLRNR